jgi:hypothetical protein
VTSSTRRYETEGVILLVELDGKFFKRSLEGDGTLLNDPPMDLTWWTLLASMIFEGLSLDIEFLIELCD